MKLYAIVNTRTNETHFKNFKSIASARIWTKRLSQGPWQIHEMRKYEVRHKNPVLLIEVYSDKESDYDYNLDARNFMHDVIVARSTKVMGLDFCGSRVLLEGPIDGLVRRFTRFNKYIKQLDKFNKFNGTSFKLRLEIMNDPGLGIMLPEDWNIINGAMESAKVEII